MQTFKDRVYHYEAVPPENTWDDIADALYNEKAIKLYKRKRSRFLFYGLTAAASIIIIFLSSLFFKTNKPSSDTYNGFSLNKSGNNAAQIVTDSINANREILNSIIHNPREKEEIVANYFSLDAAFKKYLTIEGPSGQPVKISPKVATLILSADDEYPPKPVWSNKISKWQRIMLNTTASPTSAGLMDIVAQASNNGIE